LSAQTGALTLDEEVLTLDDEPLFLSPPVTTTTKFQIGNFSSLMTIHVDDNGLTIRGIAVKPDGTVYTTSEIVKIEILIESPSGVIFTSRLATFFSDGTFLYTTSGAPFNEIGFWAFETRYTLASGQILYSDIKYEYVAKSINSPKVDANVLTIGDDILLLDGETLILN